MKGSVSFLHTNNEHTEKKFRKTIPFTIDSKKYPKINLKKEVKDLDNENYKLLKKEIEEYYRRWKDLLCLWIGRVNIMKKAILRKAIYMCSAITVKIPVIFLTETENSTLILCFHREPQEAMNNQSNIERRAMLAL
jgi:hypothetical protein